MNDNTFLPYGRQTIDEDDIKAVCEVLRSDWLTTGPKVAEFENRFAAFTKAEYAVAVNSGTAALHAAMNAVKIGPGDEVIVPAITFAATANAVVYQGGIPVFADVDPDTLLIDPSSVEKLITSKTRAITAVDYAGQPCDYERLRDIANQNQCFLVADACHSIGGKYKETLVGTLADLNVFSFHPVKSITTGEGGMITTQNNDFSEKMKSFRNHGINLDYQKREKLGSWFYEIDELGFNYRMTDFQCALGKTQLEKLPAWIEKRNILAQLYDRYLRNIPGVEPLKKNIEIEHAFHLYVVKLDFSLSKKSREELFLHLRNNGIGVNVHYIPIYYHPFYQKQGYTKGICPESEKAYEQILTLPLFPGMTEPDIQRVCTELKIAARM